MNRKVTRQFTSIIRSPKAAPGLEPKGPPPRPSRRASRPSGARVGSGTKLSLVEAGSAYGNQGGIVREDKLVKDSSSLFLLYLPLIGLRPAIRKIPTQRLIILSEQVYRQNVVLRAVLSSF
jgi:hypothetical protein